MPDLVRQNPRLNLAFAAGTGTAGLLKLVRRTRRQ
jgi:hypothetical protein